MAPCAGALFMREQQNCFPRAFFLNFLIVAIALCTLIAPGFSYAYNSTPMPDTACDPEYMDALERRAWLEAQREISQNQNIIVKPDSVLEYTCFDQFMGLLADAPLFSEVGCCGGPQDTDALNNVLKAAVLPALQNFIQSNFKHTFRGGKEPTLDYNPPGAINGGYKCNKMAQIWDISQCLNFWDSEEKFIDFASYTVWDPRVMSIAGKMCSPVIKDIDLQTAFNEKAKHHVLYDENSGDAFPYEEDPVKTHLDKILPVGVSPATKCADPIPTGLCVDRSDMKPYADAVCPNPGCHYVPRESNLDECPGAFRQSENESPKDLPILPKGRCEP